MSTTAFDRTFATPPRRPRSRRALKSWLATAAKALRSSSTRCSTFFSPTTVRKPLRRRRSSAFGTGRRNATPWILPSPGATSTAPLRSPIELRCCHCRYRPSGADRL